MLLDEVRAHCPCCGELIVLEIDRSAGAQEYIEDCPVCCRPMEVSLDETPDSRPRLRRAED